MGLFLIWVVRSRLRTQLKIRNKLRNLNKDKRKNSFCFDSWYIKDYHNFDLSSMYRISRIIGRSTVSVYYTNFSTGILVFCRPWWPSYWQLTRWSCWVTFITWPKYYLGSRRIPRRWFIQTKSLVNCGPSEGTLARTDSTTSGAPSVTSEGQCHWRGTWCTLL